MNFKNGYSWPRVQTTQKIQKRGTKTKRKKTAKCFEELVFKL